MRAKDIKKAMIFIYTIRKCSGTTKNAKLNAENQAHANSQLQSVRKAHKAYVLSNNAIYSIYLKNCILKV